MDTRNFDLNTLKALDVLLREKHVSRAATMLNVSQPALSRTLAKLRDEFRDDLLVRDGTHYVLTSRADELIEPIRGLLSDIEELLSPTEFSPSRLQGQICIASLDIEMLLLLPTLLARVGKIAPGLEVRAITINRGDLGILDSGEADFSIVARESSSGRYRRRLLYSNSHITVLNKRLAERIKNKMTLEFFTSADHGLVTVEGSGGGFVDAALSELGMERKIVTRVPNFMLIAALCASRDILFTVPRRLATAIADDSRLAFLPPPITLEPTSTFLYWHPRNHTNQTNQWFRKLIFDCSAEFTG